MKREATEAGEQLLAQAIAANNELAACMADKLRDRRRLELAANLEGVTVNRLADALGCARSTVIADLAQARKDETNGSNG